MYDEALGCGVVGFVASQLNQEWVVVGKGEESRKTPFGREYKPVVTK